MTIPTEDYIVGASSNASFELSKMPVLERRLDDIERRINDIVQHSKDVEQKAYAVDHAREQIFDACAEGVGTVYTIIRERGGGAINSLLYGKSETVTETKKKEE